MNSVNDYTMSLMYDARRTDLEREARESALARRNRVRWWQNRRRRGKSATPLTAEPGRATAPVPVQRSVAVDEHHKTSAGAGSR